jgi:hypothetical protein
MNKINNYWEKYSKQILIIVLVVWFAVFALLVILGLLHWGAPIDWMAITGLATWVLAGGVGVAIWQISETRKSTNAQIAMDLFKELRDDKTVGKLQAIYEGFLTESSIIYVLDRFEILGILVDKEIVDEDLAIHAYGGAAALRCWYKLHNYIRQKNDERGPWKINYEIFTRRCLEYFLIKGIGVKLNSKGESFDIITELLKPENKPRTSREIDSNGNMIEFIPTCEYPIKTQANELYKQIAVDFSKYPTSRELQQKKQTIELFLKSPNILELNARSEKQMKKDKMVIFTIWQKNNKIHHKMTEKRCPPLSFSGRLPGDQTN